MRRLRRGTAALLLLAAVAGGGFAVRAARAPAAGLAALGRALPAACTLQTPALVLLVDPGCAACHRAEEDLRLQVKPEEIGVHAVVLSRDEVHAAAAFEAIGPGLLPAWVFVDAGGAPRAVLRGGRPAPLLRSWLEETLARSLEPSDPNPP
jgi:hypothetical protein